MVQFLNRKLSHHNELAHCRVLGKRLSLLKGSLHSEHSHVGLLQQHCCLAPYPINPVPSWSSDFCGEPLYVLVLRDLNLQSQKGKEQVAVIERGGRYDGQPARRNSPRNGMDSIKKKKKGSYGTFKWSTACWLQGVQWKLHLWCVVKENQEA